MTVAGTTTRFTWDQAQGLPLLLDDGTNRYIYGPDGKPLQHINRDNTVTWYHHDQIGSTRLLTNSSGTTTATYTYDPYGNLTNQTGTTTTPLQYTGEYTDNETGLQYLRARYYDPTTQQFMTRDPLEATTRSPYGYVGNNPLNRLDPSGRSWYDPRDWDQTVVGFAEDHRHDIIDFGISVTAAVGVVAICGVTAGLGCAAAVIVGVGALGVGAHVGSDALVSNQGQDLSLFDASVRSGISSLSGGACAYAFGQGCPIAGLGMSGGPGLISSNFAGNLQMRIAGSVGFAATQVLKQGINYWLEYC